MQVKFEVTDESIDKIKVLFKTNRIYRMKIQAQENKRLGTVLIKTSYIPPENEWKNILDDNPFISSIEYLEDEWA